MERNTRKLLGALGLVCAANVAIVVANPDEGTLPGLFIRGDTNNDSKVNISDASFLLNFLFGGGAKPTCYEAGDINDDLSQDISDAVFLLRFLFLGDPQPPVPFPSCDYDPADAPCSRSFCNG